jgi:quercetin dioxygenase-like cupin family protein
MIRCVRLWTGDDGNSHVEEGTIVMAPGPTGDLSSGKLAVVSASFQQTMPGGHLAWHDAPVRQLVVTLSGTLDFVTRDGGHFKLAPGDVLLAEDTAGSGHAWKLIDDAPWRRLYVVLDKGAPVPFTRKEQP